MSRVARFATAAVLVVVVVVVVALVVSLSGSGAALPGAAEETWTCTALSDEDQDVYGQVDREPFDVVVGAGTFSIPSRYLTGTWSMSVRGLSGHPIWSRSAKTHGARCRSAICPITHRAGPTARPRRSSQTS